MGYKGAFADALTTVFTYAVPIMRVDFALSWLLKEVPCDRPGAGAEPAGEGPVATDARVAAGGVAAPAGSAV